VVRVEKAKQKKKGIKLLKPFKKNIKEWYRKEKCGKGTVGGGGGGGVSVERRQGEEKTKKNTSEKNQKPKKAERKTPRSSNTRRPLSE
jgi:hypothetical protein